VHSAAKVALAALASDEAGTAAPPPAQATNQAA
jgi:hypothetical protein